MTRKYGASTEKGNNYCYTHPNHEKVFVSSLFKIRIIHVIIKIIIIIMIMIMIMIIIILIMIMIIIIIVINIIIITMCSQCTHT